MDKIRFRDMQRWKSEDLKEVCPVTVTNDSQPEFVLLRLGQYNQLVQKALLGHDGQAKER